MEKPSKIMAAIEHAKDQPLVVFKNAFVLFYCLFALALLETRQCVNIKPLYSTVFGLFFETPITRNPDNSK